MGAVTIGIPFTAADRTHLPLAIRSVFAQTFEDWKLVLVADSDAPELVARIGQIDDPRVTLVADGDSKGLAARLNQIAELTTPSSILFRMDADDVMFPRRIERQLPRVADSSVVVGARGVVIDENNAICGRFRQPDLPQGRDGLFNSGLFLHPTVAAEASWFRKHPYRTDLRKAEDKELWLRSYGSSTFDAVEEELLFYRIPRCLTVAKNRVESAYNREVMRDYGVRLDCRPHAARKIAISYAKQFAFAAMVSAGLAPLIHMRKYERIDEPTRQRFGDFMAAVQRTPVPGWR